MRSKHQEPAIAGDPRSSIAGDIIQQGTAPHRLVGCKRAAAAVGAVQGRDEPHPFSSLPQIEVRLTSTLAREPMATKYTRSALSLAPMAASTPPPSGSADVRSVSR